MFCKPLFLGLAVATLLSACAEDNVDPVLVDSYRSALPSKSQLLAAKPEAAGSSTALVQGETALYPALSLDLIQGINGAVSDIIDGLEEVVEQPPTFFDSEKKEMVWGPWDYEEGVGTVTVVMTDEGEEADFRYSYMLMRGMGNDLSTMTPVIVGAGTPDPENDDFGEGITLWDLDASNAFDDANDPTAGTVPRDQGKFVAVYGHGPDKDAPANDLAFVVAAFRNWIPAEAGNEVVDSVDLDYLYGRYTNKEVSEEPFTVDFVDYRANLDVTEPEPDGVAEDLVVRMAFFNEGIGRAEASAQNGSLSESGARYEVTECWDENINQTGFDVVEINGNEENILVSTGTCSFPFVDNLSSLKIPSLDDIEPEHADAIGCLATKGVAAIPNGCNP